MKKISLKSSILLLLTSLIWGVAFVFQRLGTNSMGPFTFNGARFLLGGMVLLPFVLNRRRKKKKEEIPTAGWKITLLAGVCCGVMIGSGSAFQQIGIMHTPVGKAGFITALYIIFVPIIGIFLKKKTGVRVWISALLAAVGMYLLCMTDSFSLSQGDIYVFICAILFAVHILVIDHFVVVVDGVEMSCIQFLVAGVACSIIALVCENPMPADLLNGIIPIAYAGIMSCGVAYTFQILGQKDCDPAIASLLLSLESVFSVLAGWIILQQRLSGRELLGCAVTFAAVILVQLPNKKKTD